MEDAVKEYSYYVEDDELIIVNGKAGYIINQEKLKSQIYDEVRKIYENYQVIEIPVDYKEPDPIDLVKIHDEIYKEPKDAYVEKDPIKVHVEVNGARTYLRNNQIK